LVYKNRKQQIAYFRNYSKNLSVFLEYNEYEKDFKQYIMAIEKTKFKVIKEDGDIELREYEGYITASVYTYAEGHNTSGNQGFNSLAGYIFGDNTSRKQMSMTAPVITSKEEASEKISMTIPVMTENEEESKYKVSFVMPSQYKIDDLPTPNNSDVKLSEVPKHKSLAIKFSGYSNDSKVDEKISELKSWAKQNDITLTGKPKLARYDAPWKPGFLRHNEIIIDCK
jgi:effector-binding domain-containing protein